IFFDFPLSFTIKIFTEKGLIVLAEVIFHKLQSLFIIFHHFLGILAYNMYLLYFILIKPTELFIILYCIFFIIFFFLFNSQLIVDHHKPAFNSKHVYHGKK